MFLYLNSMANPALDSLNHILKQKNQPTRQALAIKELSHYSFIFIYRSNCPHCHAFAPVLDDFAKTYQVPVDAYSVDGGQIPPFESKRLPAELFRTFFVSGGFKAMVPALFLLNKETNEAYPVLFGEANPSQLSQRMYELMEHIKEQFNA